MRRLPEVPLIPEVPLVPFFRQVRLCPEGLQVLPFRHDLLILEALAGHGALEAPQDLALAAQSKLPETVAHPVHEVQEAQPVLVFLEDLPALDLPGTKQRK